MRKLLIFLFLTATTAVFAQFDEFDPSYNWLTIKGKNVIVHYHEEAERTAKTVCKIADEVWGPITSLYGYEPDPVHFVIKDIDDYANGASYFFDNKIEIWASSLDFDLRGAHNWLRNVISHEFTHMVQLQASMKASRSIPAVYLQYLNYEDRRRPDILYGFPNFIASYPIASINVPAWFAEGTAQYMRKDFNYDNWDSHRDMILRSYALDDKMLSWNEMGVFNKTSLGNESVYNSGFALVRYISQKYGEDKLGEISRYLGKWNNITIDAAIEDAIGIDGEALYDEWSSFLKKQYTERIKDVKANLVEGEKISATGFGNFYPKFSPDKKEVFYLSNKYSDYFVSSLYRYDLEKKKDQLVLDLVRSVYDFVPGKNGVIFAKLSDKNPKYAKIHDLYYYDIDEDEETRLTFGLRANNPSVSPDGKKITFIYQQDGTSNVGLVDIDGKNFKRLTFFEYGEQVYSPKFSPDGKFVIFDCSYHQGRDIARVNVDGSGFEYLLKEAYDERNPLLTKDGALYFASDKTGIYNIYKTDLKGGEVTRLTNVTGGAFMPDVNENGDIVYAGYTSDGYKIFMINGSEQKKVDDRKKYVAVNNPPLDEDNPLGDMKKFDIESLRFFDDKKDEDYEVSDYGGSFSRLTFFPFIRYDNYNTSNSGLDKIKPGVYVASHDMLNRFALFAGGAINKRFERDLFLRFDYRDRLPLLYNLGIKPDLAFEVFSVSRKSNQGLRFDELDESQTVYTDISYSLLEFDLSFSHKAFSTEDKFEFRFIYSKYSNTISSFIIPFINVLYPTSTSDYYRGKNIQLKYNYETRLPYIDYDINPVGTQLEIQYNYEMNDLNPDLEYDEDTGSIIRVFEEYNFHRLEVNWKQFMPVLNGHTLSAQVRAATIFGPPVDDFFDFYLGGLIGMKSYPFYAISGNELGWVNLTYRFPLFKNIDTRIGHLYLDKIYCSVYGDFGNAWTGDFPEFDKFKKGAGTEIRIKMNSFYLFPTSVFFSAAYSFDRTTRYIEAFEESVTYGKEWRFYGGILFDFAF